MSFGSNRAARSRASFAASSAWKAASAEVMDRAELKIAELLRQRHHIREGQDDDFTVRNLTALAATAARVVLRLGPPPAARWAVTGLRSVAVLAGRLTLLDGEAAFDVRAGEAALVTDSAATLLVLAGNDAAVAVGFAEPDLSVRLR